MNKNFIANLQVDKRIVELLSKSTYQKSFASAIRELISNAYDADALSVEISIDKEFKTITIVDDGNGMSDKEFEKYLRIAGSKTSDEYTRKYKRSRIGQFGVGFLAVFPFCKTLEIITTVENSSEILTAKIPAIDYTQAEKIQLVNEIPIPCTIIEDSSQRLAHYTKITFIEPNFTVLQYFATIETRKRESILTYDPFDKFIWELQEDLPISYYPQGKSYKKIDYEEPIGINVTVNGTPLYRNELQEIVLEKDTVEISGIECKYILTTSYKSIRPMEARGIKRRVNNVGVGPRTDFELKRDRGFSRLHWISGEIYFSQKIKEHLTLSRDSFIINPVIDDINSFFYEKLKKYAYYVEDIAVAEKEINQSVLDSKKGNVTPKEEVITTSLKKLRDRGFEISHKKANQSEGYNKPVNIDKENKKVIIIDKPELKKDYIFVNEVSFEIIYNKSGFEEFDPPCKIISPGVIEVNPDYPLFKSKSYGNLFKKLHIFLSIAQGSHRTSKDMYQFIVDNFLKEFEQYK